MLLAGDEARNTQHGNNNAYCQDNELRGSTGTSASETALAPIHEALLRCAEHPCSGARLPHRGGAAGLRRAGRLVVPARRAAR